MQAIFNISQHPLAVGFSRKVEVVGPFIDFQKQEITCPFDLKHFVGETLSDNYIPTQRAAMKTSNQKFVDVNGQRVFPDEAGQLPEGALGEFDFLFNYVSVNNENRQPDEPIQNKPLGEVLLEVIAFMVARNDLAKNFDDMSNFNE